MVTTFSQAGIQARNNAFYDAKRVAEFIKITKRENDATRVKQADEYFAENE